MPMLVLTIGVSGCGKSTWAAASGLAVVSSDLIRAELFGDEAVQANPALVFDVAHARVIDLLKQGKSVVFDATNVASWARQALLDKVDAEGICCKKVAVVFNVEPQRALEQMLHRSRQVPADVVEHQWEQLKSDYGDISRQFDVVTEVK